MVVNGFLTGGKFDEPQTMFSAAAAAMDVDLRIVRNCDLCAPVGEAATDSDFILFWDKDIALACNLELSGHRLFNTSDCIRVCDDKSLTHISLARAGVPSIRTVPCPKTFEGVGYADADFLDGVIDELGFPMVVKDCFGSFGKQVALVNDRESLASSLHDARPLIFQEYIECGGTDIRAEVVGGRVAAAVRRQAPPGEFRSNATLGGLMTAHALSPREEEIAIAAAEAVGADFAGVDIIAGPDGPLVCEVNSNAHIRNMTDATGIDVASEILRHIVSSVRG